MATDKWNGRINNIWIKQLKLPHFLHKYLINVPRFLYQQNFAFFSRFIFQKRLTRPLQICSGFMSASINATLKIVLYADFFNSISI